MSKKANVSTHPLVQSFITELRDKNLKSSDFRRIVHQVGLLLGYESSTDLQLQDTEVSSYSGKVTGSTLKTKVVLVPVLRGGLGLQEPFLTLFPDAPVLHIGVYRDQKTNSTETYYSSLNVPCDSDVAFILDPVCATGGNVIEVANKLKKWGVKKIKFVTIIASQYGIDRIKEAHSDVEIFAGTIDPKVDEKTQYIIPGLGHCGNRLFLSHYNV